MGQLGVGKGRNARWWWSCQCQYISDRRMGPRLSQMDGIRHRF